MDHNLVPLRMKYWKAFDRNVILVFDEGKAPHPVYTLASVSSFIWSMCDGTHTIGGIIDNLREEYGISYDQAQRDTIRFLDDLEAKGLIGWTGNVNDGFRVLLIDPPAIDPGIIGEGPKEPSIGLAYLAAVLSQENVETRILDLRRLPLKWQGILNEALDEVRPQVVGITCMSPTFQNASHIAYHVKKALPQATIVLGGHHVTFMYKEVLENNHWIDVVVIGEGEQTMRELVLRLKVGKVADEDIKGLAYRKKGKIVISPPREFIKDLDTLPFPDPYAITINRETYATARILSSRGCPFPCKFCSEAGFYNRRIRYRSPGNVLDEIEHKYRKYDFRHFIFSDDLFVLDPERVREICTGIKARDLQIEWACNTRVDTAPREIFEVMHDSGCRRLFVGVESADNRILSAMDKHSRIENIAKGIKMVNDIGIKVSAGFIIGFPGDGRETVRKSIELAKELQFDELTFTFLNVYPGTDLYNNFDKYGLRHVNGLIEYSMYRPVLESEDFTAANAMEAYLDMCYELKVSLAKSAL